MHSPDSSLRDLGFTEIESLVYESLLTDYPSTGYRVSQRIGKHNLPANLSGNEFSTSGGKLRLHENNLNFIFSSVFNQSSELS